MTIKQRALTALKQNYAKFGLKAEELDKLAEHIAGGLKDESTDEELNTAVDKAKFFAEMMQSVGNRKAAEIEKKFEGYIPKPAEPTPTPTPTPTPQPTPAGGLTLEQVQKMISESKEAAKREREEAIAAAIAPFKEKEEKVRLNNLLMGHEKLKNIPKTFSGKYSLDKEENLETLAAQIESDFTTFKQEMISSGQFVEAPATPTPENAADDFVSRMQDFGKRNAAEPAAK